MSQNRPDMLIAATINDAKLVKKVYPQYSSWHVMTPRSYGERGWKISQYTWTVLAQDLPARTRWELRQRLATCIDEHSEEQPFPPRA